MNKNLKVGLLMASTLLLVACGSETADEPVVDTPEETTEVVETVEETTEVVEEETTEDVEDAKPVYTVETEFHEGGSKELVLTGEEDERGWSARHAVIVSAEGKIVESDFNYVNAEGEFKTDDAEYVKMMEDGSGNNLPDTIDYLNNYLVENNGLEGLGDDSVDVVSGATGTYTLFVETANELLANI